ncbi:MAG: sensor histidine kinase [Jiangellaceae bacterium]
MQLSTSSRSAGRPDRSGGLSAPAQDRLLTLVLLVVHLLNPQSGSSASAPSSVLAGVALTGLTLSQTIPLLWRRTRPALVIGVVGVSWVLVQPVAGAVVPFALWVAVYSAIVYARRRAAELAALGTVLAVAAVRAGWMAEGSGWEDSAPLMIVTLLVVIGGFVVADRRARTEALRERAAFLEREREALSRQAVAEERLRIARELHDLVAHSLSTIAIQSSTARMALLGNPETALTALRGIETSSREATREMRQLLGVLRSTDDVGGRLEPAPGLAELDALVAKVRSAGARVDVQVEGEARPLPAGVDLVAYRVVQEAMTNVIRHAGSASAKVLVRYGADDLLVGVTDTGPVQGTMDPAPDARAPVDRGAGHGLLGMKERVSSVHGEFHAGPRAGGGWSVSARLPLSLEDSR